jgi:biotin carboxylase
MDGSITHVVVAQGGILTRLDQLLPERSVLVLEEAEINSARELTADQSHPCVANVLSVPTQAEDDLRALLSVARPPAVRAVIPAKEYAVVAAAWLAEQWGLAGAGVDAARALRDKVRLRQVAAAHGISQPVWEIATGPADAVRIRGRGSCVIKPSNRQGSLGVTLIGENDSDDLVRSAWNAVVGATEAGIRTSHMPTPEILVEERLFGREVSVEALVCDGTIVFENVTDKVVQPGPFPVEVGHSVPAVLTPDVRARLSEVTYDLVEALKYGSGVLHAEWMLVDGEPHLIECAGRLPGDRIVDLIDLAYGGNLVADFVTVLEGKEPSRSQQPVRGAAVHFVQQRPGTVREVRGVSEVEAADEVVEVEMTAKAGDRIELARSSWQRAGHVVVAAEDGASAAAAAARQAGRITMETDT